MADVPTTTSLRDRITSLTEWWKLVKDGDATTRLLLDLRPTADFDRRRLLPSSSPSSTDPHHPGHHRHHGCLFGVVPIAADALEERSFELPARHVTFSVLLAEQDLEHVSQFLLKGGKNNKTNEANSINHGKRKRRLLNPWKVAHVLIDSNDLWQEAKNLMILDDYYDYNNNTPNETRSAFQPLARLWQPDPMVEMVLLPLLVKSIAGRHIHSNQQQQQLLEVWDLASGAGRDVAFLAEELLAATTTSSSSSSKGGEGRVVVVGCDHRYNAKETKTVSDFWDRRGLDRHTRCLKMDLSGWETLEHQVDLSTLMAMFCVRFWKSELVEAIAASRTMPSGVLFGLSHFCKPTTGASWNFDHPSEKTVLERNQLRDLFGRHDWEIIHDEIAMDSDHGRTMVHFVARR